MRRHFALLSIILFSLISSTTLSATRGISLDKPAFIGIGDGRFFALIIGNAKYKDKNNIWKPLNTTVNGANALAKILSNKYQFFNVTVLEDSTRREILLALSDLNKKIKKGDSVLVYYAGHGFLDINTGLGYWIPIDGEGKDHTTYIRNSTIRDELSVISKHAKHTLLISDSCFSGSLLQSNTRGTNFSPNDQRYYQKVANKKSVQIMTAGGNEFVDDDYNNSGMSPFTHFLLNELNYNNAFRLSATELAQQVRKAVSANVQQTPQSGILQGAGDELGEFVFVSNTIYTQETIKTPVMPSTKQINDNLNDVIRRRLPLPVF